MKFIVAALSFLFCCHASFGVVQITWQTNSPFEVKDDIGNNAPSGWIAQLILTGGDGIRDAFDPANPFTPSNDDVVLETQPMNTIALDGFIIGPGSPQNYPDSAAGGFVYTRVFNTFSVAVSPTLYGESINQSGPTAVFVPIPPTFPTIHSPEGVVVNLVIVPEPGTFALAGLGGLLLLWRHRRRTR